MLGQCTVLTHLDLRGNYSGAVWTESLAGVFGQCTTLTHLDLRNQIGPAGAENLPGVLGQCTVLVHLNLGTHLNLSNDIDTIEDGRIDCSLSAT